MMTEEDMRDAIVNSCQPLFVRPTGQAGWNYHSAIAGRILACTDGDPLKDRNAMAGAALSLGPFKGSLYASELRRIVVRDSTKEMKNVDTRIISDLYFYEATALQRAEAMCRVICPDKWDSTPCSS